MASGMIHRVQLKIQPHQIIEVPANAQIISVLPQGPAVNLYYISEVEESETRSTEILIVFNIESPAIPYVAVPIQDGIWFHVNSFSSKGSSDWVVFHVFEKGDM